MSLFMIQVFVTLFLFVNVGSFSAYATHNSASVNVRLQGGNQLSGRLEFFHNGTWGTVCDDFWDMTDSHVACRQLGFESAVSFTNRNSGATGQIWLDDVRCNGNEASIQQCRHRGWGVHDCDHSEDVHLNCYQTAECTNHTVLNSRDRAQTYTYLRRYCDYYDITDGLWYRFMGDAGTAIATSCVPTNRCGTHASGWMNGSHPTQADGIVNRTVCYNYNSNCCMTRNDIRVKNCGGFYVYQLVRPSYCTLRYCGNGQGYGCAHDNTTCLNGGTCRNSYYGYYCSCLNGYSGRRCETRFGCGHDNTTCLNGGTCRNTYYGSYGYYCSCPNGYSGRHCETRYGCARDNTTCLNGGTCRNTYYGYYCSCHNGYSGRRCETRYGCSHDNTTCLNGGTCRNTYYGYYCSCPNDYSGRRCETRYGCARDSNTCLNGGTCRNTYYGYYCSCPNGYSGRHCETRFGCAHGNTTCLNGGTCRNSYYGDYCSCPNGYSGRRCETRYGCAHDNTTCRNGGTCRNTYYGYYCSCPNGYSGRDCETRYGCARDSNTCLNGGTCRNTYYGYYYCSCPNGYSGRHCETNLKTRVTCGERHLEVELRKDFYRDIDWRDIHLNDPACRATTTWSAIRLRSSLDGCGTTCIETNGTFEFWNKVIVDYRYSGGNSSITRKPDTLMKIYCKYARRQLVSTSFIPSKKIVHVSEGNIGNFTFTMNLYKTSRYQTPYSPFNYPVPVSLNEPLWVQFEVKNTIADLVVFADSCHATTSINPNSYPQYVYLKRGCVRDSTVVYNYNSGSSVQRFSIKSFRFVYSNNKLVYLHCDLMVCHRNSTISRCSRGCINSRRRREAPEDEGSSKLYDLSAGPFHGRGGNSKNNKQAKDAMSVNVGMSAGLGVVGGLLLIVCGVMLYKKMLKLYPGLLNHTSGSPSPPLAMDVTVNSYEQNDVDLDEKKVEIQI